MRKLVVGLVLSLSALTGRARADDSSEADRLFQEGKRLVESGNYVAACTRFEASLAREPGIGARLWLAECYGTLGRTATSQAQFRIAADEAHRAGDRREQVARRRADELEPRVVHIVVQLEKAAPGERIEVDGAALGGTGTALAVDPGRHLVTATATGCRPWQLTFDAASPANPISVIVPELVPLAPPVPAGAAAPPPPARSRWQRTTGLALGGVGGAGLAVGGVLAVLAIRDNARSKDGCSSTECTGDAHAQRLGAKEEANGATAAFVAGGALLGAGATLFFLAPRSSVTVKASLRGVGLDATF